LEKKIQSPLGTQLTLFQSDRVELISKKTICSSNSFLQNRAKEKWNTQSQQKQFV